MFYTANALNQQEILFAAALIYSPLSDSSS